MSRRRLDCEGHLIKLPLERRSRKARRGAPAWMAPKRMPDWQARMVVRGQMCGAPLANGHFCRRTDIRVNDTRTPPYLCSQHLEERREKERQQADGRGFYAPGMRSDEEPIYRGMTEKQVSSLDDEIALVKIRLRRECEAEIRQAQKLAGEQDPERALDGRSLDELMIEVRRTTGTTPDGSVDQKQVQRKLVDHAQRIHALISQLARLVEAKLKHEGGGGMHPHERAAIARQAAAAMEEMGG